MSSRRKIQFKQTSEKITFVTFTGMILAMYFFELIVIIPKIDAREAYFHKNVHIFFGTLILLNLIASIYKFLTTDATSGSKVLPSSLEKGWRFCWKCEANAPPRSMHCFTCDQCILARDHHCVLVAHCVGHATLRYFMSMMLNLWLALFYSNCLNFEFVWDVYQSLAPKTLLTMFVPWLAWVLGMAESETFLMAIFTSICVLGFLYATFMLAFHGWNLVNGKTTYEFNKKLGHSYNLGFKENMRNAFGVNWKYAWVCPLIPSSLPGDGITFEERELPVQNGKEM